MISTSWLLWINAAMNRYTNITLRSHFPFFCLFPSVRLMDHMVILFLMFWGTWKRHKTLARWLLYSGGLVRWTEWPELGSGGRSWRIKGLWDHCKHLASTWDGKFLEGWKHQSDILEGRFQPPAASSCVEQRQQGSRCRLRASGQNAVTDQAPAGAGTKGLLAGKWEVAGFWEQLLIKERWPHLLIGWMSKEWGISHDFKVFILND